MKIINIILNFCTKKNFCQPPQFMLQRQLFPWNMNRSGNRYSLYFQRPTSVSYPFSRWCFSLLMPHSYRQSFILENVLLNSFRKKRSHRLQTHANTRTQTHIHAQKGAPLHRINANMENLCLRRDSDKIKANATRRLKIELQMRERGTMLIIPKLIIPCALASEWTGGKCWGVGGANGYVMKM